MGQHSQTDDGTLYVPEADGMVAMADGDYRLEDIPEATPPARDGAGVRAGKTLLQGGVYAALTAVITLLAGAQFGPDTDWKLLGYALAQAAGTAIISYLHNSLGRKTD